MIHPLPLVLTFPHALVFWLVFVWTFLPERTLVKNAKRASDPSLKVLLLTNQVAMVVAFAIAFTLEHGRIGGQWSFWVGTALILAGSLLRRHCFRMLGQSFTGDVQVTQGQVVVNKGAYRFVRHPAYTGGLVMFLGIGLALGNWWSVAAAVTGALIGYGYRIHVEERAMLATLGPRYAEYAAGRKRLIPFLL